MTLSNLHKNCWVISQRPKPDPKEPQSYNVKYEIWIAGFTSYGSANFERKRLEKLHPDKQLAVGQNQ